MYPLLFHPNLQPVIWGGHQLRPWKGLSPDDEPIGESWEVSAVPTKPSVVLNGPMQGRPLTEVVEEWGAALLGEQGHRIWGGKFPLLAKFIDARTDLSIQVHPNDEMALREHDKMGKTEMWYVIHAQPGAALYAGFRQEITPEEYRRRVADGTITEVLARHEVKSGDVFYIPAGRIHAICGGVLLAEVQQSSDVTYRIYDYGRTDANGRPRELHTALAAQALDYTVEHDYRTHYTTRENGATLVVDTPYFSVRVSEVTTSLHRDLIKYDSFIISMCLEGACRLHFRTTGDEILLTEGNSCLIPATIADYDVIPMETAKDKGTKKCRILESFIDYKDRSLLHCVTRFLHITKK